MQVASEIEKAGSGIKKLKVLAVYGGQPIGKQTRVLKKGVHIIVGTPGRVIDHIQRGNLDLIGVESVVLDEADEMLSRGFKDQVCIHTGSSFFLCLFRSKYAPKLCKSVHIKRKIIYFTVIVCYRRIGKTVKFAKRIYILPNTFI